MVFHVPQYWDIAGDGFQIFLCLLILGFYLKNRAIYKKCAVSNKKKGVGQSFNAHVFNLTAQQIVNQAFTNIIQTIAAERNSLESELGLGPLSSEDYHISEELSNSQAPDGHDNHSLSDDRSESVERYDKVRKFSGKGQSARKISEEMRIPISEVELILSLQKN